MKKTRTTTAITMREFRAAPAKILRRAARTRTRLRIGDLVLVVEEEQTRNDPAAIHGCMRATGRALAPPSELLSVDDPWSADE